MSDFVLATTPALQLVLPVVGAVFVVVAAVYAFGVRSSSTTPPTLEFFDVSPLSSKKSKPSIKKKPKPAKKEKISNGHAQPIEEKKPAPIVPKAATPAPKKPVKQPANKKVQDAGKDEEKLAAARLERAEKKAMRKEATEGDWVTVGSKDKKSTKSRSTPEPEVDVPAEEQPAETGPAAQTAIPDNKYPKKAKKPVPVRVEETIVVEKTPEPVKKEEGAKSTKSKSKSASSAQPAKEAAKDSAQPVQTKSNKKTKPVSEPAKKTELSKNTEPSKMVEPATEPVKPAAAVRKAPVVEELVEKVVVEKKSADPENGDPAFDEMGDWETAKPLKMKKRARRER